MMTEAEHDELPCSDKLQFSTREEAQAAATVEAFRYGTKLHVYKCRFCGMWHLSSGSAD